MRGIILIIMSLIGLYAQSGYPYKPKPILFVHGYNANSGTWGVKPDSAGKISYLTVLPGLGPLPAIRWPGYNPSTDSIIRDSIKEGDTYDRFLPLMIPYAKTWFSIDSSYTWDEAQPGYPNKSFLEVWNADYPLGSIDSTGGGGYFPAAEQVGWGDEIAERIRRVLREYYGDNWRNDTSAKVIVVAHSMGAASTRWALTLYPDLVSHVAKVISVNSPQLGTPPMNFFPLGEVWWIYHTFWIPWYRPLEVLNPKTWLNHAEIYALFAIGFNFGLSFLAGELGALYIAKYTDAGNDLGEDNYFMQKKLNSRDNLEFQRQIRFAFVGGKYPLPTQAELTITYITVGQAIYYGSKWWDPTSLVIASLKMLSGFLMIRWFRSSDEAVPFESQMMKGTVVKGKEVTEVPLSHTDAPHRYDLILQALEEKPKIDTVYMSFPADGGVDTVILGLKEIDTVVANLDSVNIFFKLKNVYFLAQTKLSVNINGVPAGKLEYPEDKGFDGRWCKIPSGVLRFLGAGLNELTITARNILGEQVSRTFKIWLVPAGWFVWNRFPLHREVFNPLDLSISSDSFSLYIVKEGLDSAKLIIAWDSLYIIPVGVYQDTAGRYHFDTLETRYYVNSDYYYHSPPGERYLIKPDGDTLPAYGKVFAVSFNDMRGYLDKDNDGRIDEGAYRFIYKINDSVEIISFLTGFYVDETPPVVELLEPEGVVSGRRQKILFSFRAYDNLEEEVQTPDSMVFEIYRGWEAAPTKVYEMKKDSLGFYYYGDRKLLYIQKNIFPEDGKYFAVIKIYDRTGNKGEDTIYFRLDSYPPEITITEKMEPVLNSGNKMVEFKYEINEYADITLFVRDTMDTTYLIEKQFTGIVKEMLDSLGFDTLNSVFITGEEIKDGVYEVWITVKDSAGNDTTIYEGLVSNPPLSSFTKGEILIVDKTKPQVTNLSVQPLVADNYADLSFVVSQVNDVPVNRGQIKIKIYLDTILKDSFFTSDTLKEFNLRISLTGVDIGRHFIRVYAFDEYGNSSYSEIPVYKRTFGTEITRPFENDTLKKGVVIIKGIASDPDRYNPFAFDRYELWWKVKGDAGAVPEVPFPGNWKKINIFANESSDNIGRKEITTVSLLGTWNTIDLPPGDYVLLLISYDKANRLLADSVNVYISDEIAENPEVVILKELREKEPFNLKLEPAKMESLLVNYRLSGIMSDLQLDIISSSGEIVASFHQDSVMPFSGKPVDFSKSGYYIYEENDSLYILFKGKPLWGFSSISIQGIGLDSVSVLREINTDSLHSVIVTGNNVMLFISDSSYADFGVVLPLMKYKVSSAVDTVYLGKNLYSVSGEFYLGGKIFLWTGRRYPQGTPVGSGKYLLRLKAMGSEGYGYAYAEDTVFVKTDFKFDSAWVVPKEVVLEDTTIVNVYLKVNTDCYVRWTLVKAGDIGEEQTPINEIVVGSGEEKVFVFNNQGSFYVMLNDVGRLETGRYKFYLIASPDSQFSESKIRVTSFILTSVPMKEAPQEVLYIPDRYLVPGTGGVYNGKPEYLISVKPSGRYVPPFPYSVKVKKTGYNLPVYLKWKAEFGKDSVERRVVPDTIVYYFPFAAPRNFRATVQGLFEGQWWSIGNYYFEKGFRYTAIQTGVCTLFVGGLPRYIGGYLYVNKYDSSGRFISETQFPGCQLPFTQKRAFKGIKYDTVEIHYFVKIKEDSGSLVLIDTNAVYYDFSSLLPLENDYTGKIPLPSEKWTANFNGEVKIWNVYRNDTVIFNVNQGSEYYQIGEKMNDTIILVLLKRDNGILIDTLLKVYFEGNADEYPYQYLPLWKSDITGGFTINYWRFYVGNNKIFENYIGVEMENISAGGVYITSETENFFKRYSFIINKKAVKKTSTVYVNGLIKWKNDSYSQDTIRYDTLFQTHLALEQYQITPSQPWDSTLQLEVNEGENIFIVSTTAGGDLISWDGTKDDKLCAFAGTLKSFDPLIFTHGIFPSKGKGDKVKFIDIYKQIDEKWVFKKVVIEGIVNYLREKDSLIEVPVYLTPPNDNCESGIGECEGVIIRKPIWAEALWYRGDSVVKVSDIMKIGVPWYSPRQPGSSILRVFKRGNKWILEENKFAKSSFYKKVVLDTLPLENNDSISVFINVLIRDSFGVYDSFKTEIPISDLLKNGINNYTFLFHDLSKKIDSIENEKGKIHRIEYKELYVGIYHKRVIKNAENMIFCNVPESSFVEMWLYRGFQDEANVRLFNVYPVEIYPETQQDDKWGINFNIKLTPLSENPENLYLYLTGNNSNPYLIVDKWDSLRIFDIKGNPSPDLTLDTIKAFGFGNDVYDYFKPRLKLSPKPQEWLPIRGVSEKDYKLIAKHKGKIFELTPEIINGDTIDRILGFLPSSEVAGNVKFLLYQYENGELNNVYFRTFKIGDPVDKMNFETRSPFSRVLIKFKKSLPVDIGDTTQEAYSPPEIANVYPLLPEEIELGGSTPYIGAQISPIVKFLPYDYSVPSPSYYPSLYYKFLFSEINEYNIDTNNLKLFAFRNDGMIYELSTIHSKDEQNEHFILNALFPLDGNNYYAGGFYVNNTLQGRVYLFYPMVTRATQTGDSILIRGIANFLNENPENVILKIIVYNVSGKPPVLPLSTGKGNISSSIPPEFYRGENINKLLIKGNKLIMSTPTQSFPVVYRDTIKISQDGRFKEKIFLYKGIGDYFWIYVYADPNYNEWKNSPVGFTYFVRPYISSPLILTLLGERNPLIRDTIGAYLKFTVSREATVFYFQFIDSTWIEIENFRVYPYDTFSIYWNGKDPFGNYLPTGEYPYLLYAVDDYGIKSNEETGYWQIIRRITVNILNPSDGEILGDTVLLLAEIEGEEDYPIDWFAYYNNKPHDIGTQISESTPLLWITDTVPEGINISLIATATHPIGITGSDSVNIILDHTLPLTYMNLSQPFYEKERITFVTSKTQISFYAHDNLSGVEKTEYRILPNIKWNVFKKPFSLLGEDGLRNMQYRSKDKAGNYEEIKEKMLFLDNTAPSIEIEINQPRYDSLITYISDTTLISLYGYDSGSGLKELVYAIDDTDYVKYSVPFTITDEGVRRINIKAIDNLGNACDTMKEVAVDKTYPETDYSVGEPKVIRDTVIYLTSSTGISLSSIDPLSNGVSSGLKAVYYRINQDKEEYVSPLFITGSDGIYEFGFYGVDRVLNQEPETVLVLYLDNTPPVTRYEIGEPRYVSDRTYINSYTPITFKVFDEGVGIDSAWYRVDGGLRNYYRDSVRFTIGEHGLHLIEYGARDSLNNFDFNEFGVAVDTVSPNTVLSLEGPYVEGDTVLIGPNTMIILLSEDPLIENVASGVKSIYYRIDEGEWNESSENPLRISLNLSDGIYRMGYYSEDNVLNKEREKEFIFKFDGTPPFVKIISPPDSSYLNLRVPVIGTVEDEHISYYRLEYGRGENPVEWNLISEGISAERETLGSFDARNLEYGIYTIRLYGEDKVGNTAEDRIYVFVGIYGIGLIIDGLHKPTDVWVSAGRIYVTDDGKCREEDDEDEEHIEIDVKNHHKENGRLLIYDLQGNLVGIVCGVEDPRGVAVDEEMGRVYVIQEEGRHGNDKKISFDDEHEEGNKVVVFTLDGDSLFEFGEEIFKPEGITIGYEEREKRVFIADRNGKRIWVYTLDGDLIRNFGTERHNTGIAIDEKEILYVSEDQKHKVMVFKNDTLVNEYYERFIKPRDVYYEKGRVWVCDRNNDRILAIDTLGIPLYEIRPKGEGRLNKPEGVWTGFNEVFVADRNNDRIVEFILEVPILFAMGTGGIKKGVELDIRNPIGMPNLFNPEKGYCDIRFELTKPADVEVIVFTIGGKRIWRTVISGFTGGNSVMWDGRDDKGEVVSSGAYLVLIRARSGREIKEKKIWVFVVRK